MEIAHRTLARELKVIAYPGANIRQALELEFETGLNEVLSDLQKEGKRPVRVQECTVHMSPKAGVNIRILFATADL